MAQIRPPAVAGLFYPAEPDALREQVLALLAAARPPHLTPKALVVPHAGYAYSGPTAASAYALLQPLRQRINRVVLLGPSHRVPLHGMAASDAEQFRTPLGDIPLDVESLRGLRSLPQVRVFNEAHGLEHSLEVQLPFLQICLNEFSLLPLVVGDCAPAQVAQVLTHCWGGAETLVLISTDLSHFLDYATAQQRDGATSRAIERLDAEAIGEADACGRMPLRGLLHLARQQGLKETTLDVRNSGDTAGDRARVVGYGAYAFH